MSFRIISCLMLLFFSVQLWTQTNFKIQLLDLENSLPISEVTYEYGAKNGISNEHGFISFEFMENQKMTLSHLSYGIWEWDESVLWKIIQAGTYYRRSQTINLYPITIISVQSKTEPDENIRMNFSDRMVHDGASILNQIPAFNSIRKSGNYGNDPVFRGYKYDQLNVVLDGAQSATAACPNRMDPPTSQMAPNMMDRIEVLKGPHALRYGTGFGGTINFVPFKLRFSEASVTYGRISSGYESNGDNLQAEGLLGLSGQSYNINLLGAWAQGNDYSTGNQEKVQADFSRGSFGTNVGLRLSSSQQLRLTATYNVARDADFPALPMDLREDDTWMFNARHDVQIQDKNLQSWTTSIFGSWVDHRMDNFLKPLNPRVVNAYTDAQTYNYGGRTEGTWSVARSKIFTGMDFRTEGADGIRTREFVAGPNNGKVFQDNAWQNGRITKSAVFGEYHLYQNSMNYTFSTRLELNAADVSDPSSEFSQIHAEPKVTQFNPSFSLGMKKLWNDIFSSGLWLGRAQRSAGLAERYINYFPIGQDPYELLGNPNLKPEVNNQLDLTFLYTKKRSSLNLDLFASYLQNYISSFIDPELNPRLPNSPGVRQFTNIDQAVKLGFEINWKQELIANLNHEMGVAYTYAQDMDNDEALPEIPPLDFQYILSGSFIQDRLNPEVIFRYVSEQPRISTQFGETITPAFSLLDIQVRYDLTENIKIHAGVKNMFDNAYYEHLSRSVRGAGMPLYAPGRNYFGRFSVAF